MTIEVEIRAAVDKAKYDELLQFFKKNAEFLGEDYQESYYFDSPQDLRIQRNNKYSKIWMKKGKMHDEHREEFEIRFGRDQFEELEKMFNNLGFNVNIKWYRNRHEFNWSDIYVTVDYTKGYGYILELERKCEEAEKEAALKDLKAKLAALGLQQADKAEMDKRFQNYKQNWKALIASDVA